MKQVHPAFFIWVCMGVFLSCNRPPIVEAEKKSTLSIQNNTDYTVQVVFKNSASNAEPKEYTLEPATIVALLDKTTDKQLRQLYDSVYFYFEKDFVLKNSSQDNTRNIFSESAYKKLSETNDKVEYLYEITPLDIEKAEKVPVRLIYPGSLTLLKQEHDNRTGEEVLYFESQELYPSYTGKSYYMGQLFEHKNGESILTDNMMAKAADVMVTYSEANFTFLENAELDKQSQKGMFKKFIAEMPGNSHQTFYYAETQYENLTHLYLAHMHRFPDIVKLMTGKTYYEMQNTRKKAYVWSAEQTAFSVYMESRAAFSLKEKELAVSEIFFGRNCMVVALTDVHADNSIKVAVKKLIDKAPLTSDDEKLLTQAEIYFIDPLRMIATTDPKAISGMTDFLLAKENVYPMKIICMEGVEDSFKGIGNVLMKRRVKLQ